MAYKLKVYSSEAIVGQELHMADFIADDLASIVMMADAFASNPGIRVAYAVDADTVQLAELPEDWREVALEGELSRAQIVEIDAWLTEDPCAECALDLRDHDAAQLIECETQHQQAAFGPSREGSPNCQSGSLASGGTKTYCTCDTCF
jgi:hypothetical protein